MNFISTQDIAQRSQALATTRSTTPQMQQTQDLPDQRRVGRFRETRRVKLLRAAFRAIAAVSPAAATRLGYQILATPPLATEGYWQADLRLRASPSMLRFGKGWLAVYEWGVGPTVLMVHGWGARATHMGRMIDPLVRAGFRVVSFDAPAHGNSTGKTTDLVEFAAAVNAVAQFAGPIHTLLAHSFGVAMALLARRDWGVEAQKQVLISSFDHCIWFSEAFGKYIGLRPALVERMRQLMVDRYDGRFNWSDTSVVEMLRRARRPTLLIHDEDDKEIPVGHSIALLQGAPHAELLVTSGLGHHRLLGDSSVIEQVVRFVQTSPVKTASIR
jgi:pimeloyl-ACP methyl ester carboxylesterase